MATDPFAALGFQPTAKPTTNTPTSGDAFSALGFQPTTPNLPTPQDTTNEYQTKGVLGAVSRFSGVDTLGRGLGTAINNMAGGTDELHKSIEDGMKIQSALLKRINEKKARGEDVSHLMSALQNSTNDIQNSVKSYQDVTTGGGITNKEVLGSAAQTAINIGSAGLAGPTSLAGKVAQGAALGYGYDVSNNLMSDKGGAEIAKPGLGTVVGGGLPFLTALTGAVAKRVTGALTGAGKDVIQRAIENPDAVGEAVSTYANNDEGKTALVDRAKAAISDFLHQRSVNYGNNIDTLTSQTGFLGKQAAVDSFKENLAIFGGMVTPSGELKFTDSTLTRSDQNNLRQAWSTISKWKNTSVKGSDGLRQAIGNLMDDFKVMGNPRSNVILGNVKGDLTSHIANKVSGYTDMLGQYGKETSTAKNLLSELSLGRQGTKPSTQLNQVMKIFQKDPSVTKNIYKVMGKEAGDQFLNDVSGAILSDWVPAGKMGVYFKGLGELGIGAGAALLGHPVVGLGVAPAMMGTSPKIVGAVARAAGKSAQAGINTGIRRTVTAAASKLGQ